MDYIEVINYMQKLIHPSSSHKIFATKKSLLFQFLKESLKKIQTCKPTNTKYIENCDEKGRINPHLTFFANDFSFKELIRLYTNIRLDS